MIVPRHAGTVQALYAALDAREFERAAEELAEEILLLNVATGDVHRGRPGFLEHARGWTTAFPDLTFEHLRVEDAGSRVVVEYERHGTHTGPLITPRSHIPPTGMEIQLRACDVVELSDDRVSRVRSYFDSATLLRQLGLGSGAPLHGTERRASLELFAQPLDGNAPQRHKAIVHRFLQDVFNRQNPGAAVDTCAQDLAWHGGVLGETEGLRAYQNVLASFFLAFPDLNLEVLDMIAEEDRVVVRFTMSGTHLGEFQGIAPTFKPVSGGGTNTYRIEDSRIAEEWWQGDVLLLMKQMDAVPQALRLSSF